MPSAPDLHVAEDLYHVLGISKDASTSQVKKAYKKAVLKVHPDKQASNSSASAEAFISVQNAYQVLSDGVLRHRYDMLQKRKRGSSMRFHTRSSSQYRSRDFKSDFFDTQWKNYGKSSNSTGHYGQSGSTSSFSSHRSSFGGRSYPPGAGVGPKKKHGNPYSTQST
eukprot:g3300.t1